MADDVDAPHDKYVEIPDASLAVIANEIIRTRYLASIDGGKATWILRRKQDGEPLVVIAQQWESPRYLIDETSQLDLNLVLYLEYYCQVDPDLVWHALDNEEPLPDRHARKIE
ncbi:MAG: hypothetical protein R3C11_06550 [Planctomycetaceae bacterium]